MNEKFASWWRLKQGDGLYNYHRLILRTTRLHFEGRANVTQARVSKRPILWSMWHGQLPSFFIYADRFENAENFISVVVGDKRGDILARLGERVGAHLHRVDMSGNPVAGGRSVLNVIKGMKAGYDSFIAPDGPDGPAFEPKRGVAFLAKKAQASIVPMGLWADNAYFMNRWDQYQLPYPLANIYCVFGKPIEVSRRDDEDKLLSKVTEALNKVRDRAKALAERKK